MPDASVSGTGLSAVAVWTTLFRLSDRGRAARLQAAAVLSAAPSVASMFALRKAGEGPQHEMAGAAVCLSPAAWGAPT